MATRKVGDKYSSTLTDLSFTITNVEKGSVTVDVERSVKKRDGASAVETRSREVPDDVWPYFVRSYRKDK